MKGELMFYAEDFEVLKANQYCDNSDCAYFTLVGAGNIRIHSRQKGQVYCSICKNRWVITKGTIRYGLKTPLKKIINTLLMMSRGMGLRKACRQQGVTPEAAKKWVKKASEEVDAFTMFMHQEMNLEEKQIAKFWQFIKDKRSKKKSDKIKLD